MKYFANGRTVNLLYDIRSLVLIIHKSKHKPVRKCKVLICKIHHSVCRLSGEEVDNARTEIASTLPLTTLAEALEMDEKLNGEEFGTSMKQFVIRIKGSSDSVHDVLRHLYADEFLYLCNWDGIEGKQPLSKFLLVPDILYDFLYFVSGPCYFSGICNISTP
ncbi:uncharacterized protein [Bactrocera oleae]|uniref:uncharacterized protein isoform X2 n=1 Tax=Bactrocera oleae TaxID=104688 RepID=UPI00387EC755